jgi:hypothetical protein
MKTREQVEKFFKDHPINTGGAINQYKIVIEPDVDDGDVWRNVKIPFWSNNDIVVSGVLSLIEKIRKWDHDVHICLEKNEFHVVFVESACDPD